MTTGISISRRTFLKAGALVAGGLVIAFAIPQAKRFLKGDAAQTPVQGGTLPEPNAFLRIGTDNTITVLLAHSEMGQGIWTTLPMLIAEELDADWQSIKVEHAEAAPVYAHTAYGMQITGGSSTTWSEFDRYRQAGALTRALLVQAAAQKLGVNAEQLSTENGMVIHGNEKIPYGDLAELAATIEVPKAVTLKTPEQWKIIGKATKRLDSTEKINGSARFGLDVQWEGLKTALVARAPVFGAKLKSYDPAAALQIKGVIKVVQVPTGVAVIGEHFWAAKQGRDALKVDWDLGPNAAMNTAQMLDDYRKAASSTGNVAAKAGDLAVNMQSEKPILEAEYFAPFLAHAPMEPLNCAVKITDTGCEIWTGTQMQTIDQKSAAEILGVAPERVKIHTQFLGGGFGRRANPRADFVSEAVHVAKAGGMPVKTVWTREDDVHGGFYRPMFLHKLKVAQDTNGMPKAWQHVLVGQSIAKGTPFESFMIKEGVDALSVEGVADSPYMKAVPHHEVSLHTMASDIPVLWWRSVGHSHSAFVMESVIDELAHAAGQDPLEYRRKLLAGHSRHLGVLNMAAEKAGWGNPLPAGVARGIAVHESFGSTVAQVAEVSVNDGQVKVHRVVAAIDCGLAINPEGVAAQVESAIAYGLSAALTSEITFDQGQVVQTNFHNYQVLRLPDMPQVEVHIVPSTEKMGGVGEPGLPPIAPAVTNALFVLTGKRIRQLPIANQLKQA